MSTWQLTLRQRPALRLDLRSLSPTLLAGLSAAEIEHLPLPCGNALTPLGEWFSLQPLASDAADLRLVGDLSRCDRIGWQLDQGRVQVEGSAGDYLGAAMRGGSVSTCGDAGALAGCEMAGGTLHVAGNVGDFAASALPGSMDGMRGGLFVVQGHAGERLADRMRRGTLVVHGNAGDFAASRLVAGTVAVGGALGAHPGWGMRRGSLLCASARFEPPATWVPAGAEAPVFWQLLARDLATHGGAFADLPRRQPTRWLGDLAADGKGELIFPD